MEEDLPREMTHEQFCYWLRGFFELNSTETELRMPTKEQWAMIGEHLELTMIKTIPQITPPYQITWKNSDNDIKFCQPWDGGTADSDIQFTMSDSLTNFITQANENKNFGPFYTEVGVPNRTEFLKKHYFKDVDSNGTPILRDKYGAIASPDRS